MCQGKVDDNQITNGMMVPSKESNDLILRPRTLAL
jgi:hypothetical protein